MALMVDARGIEPFFSHIQIAAGVTPKSFAKALAVMDLSVLNCLIRLAKAGFEADRDLGDLDNRGYLCNGRKRDEPTHGT